MVDKINVKLQDASGHEYEFDNVKQIVRFLETELKYWEAAYEGLDVRKPISPYIQFRENLNRAVNAIQKHLTDTQEYDDSEMNSIVNSVINNNLINQRQPWLCSQHEIADIFVECHTQYGSQAANACLNYLIRGLVDGIGNIETFHGIMVAYEYKHQGSDILKRRNSEVRNVKKLTSQLQEIMHESISNYNEFQSDYHQWQATVEKEWEKMVGDCKSGLDEDRGQYKSMFGNFMTESRDEKERLEQTYIDHMRLKGPAQYWKIAAKKFASHGFRWMVMLVLFLGVGVILFSMLFVNWIMGQELGIKLNTVQGVVLFGSLLAIYAYLIRVLSKMTFSSYHLMRDAEERRQLTYLYLALSKDVESDDKAREIILQALFSRSDTGLLGPDSGPSIPSANDIIKVTNKSG